MNKGVPTLTSAHKLCDKGKALTSEQAQLLKLIGEKMIVFRVRLMSRWDSTSGEVVQIEGDELSPEDVVAGDVEEDEGTMSE